MNADIYILNVIITYNEKKFNFKSKDFISLESLKKKSKKYFDLTKISNNLIEFSLEKDKNIKISTNDDIIKYINDSNLEDIKLELNLSIKKIDINDNNNKSTSKLNNNKDNLIKEKNKSKGLLSIDEKSNFEKEISKLNEIIKQKDEIINEYKSKIEKYKNDNTILKKSIKNNRLNKSCIDNEMEKIKKENEKLKKEINLLEKKLKNNKNFENLKKIQIIKFDLNINKNILTPKAIQNSDLNPKKENTIKDTNIPETTKYEENNNYNQKSQSLGELNNKETQETEANITPNENNINQNSQKENNNTPNPALNEKIICTKGNSKMTPKGDDLGNNNSKNLNDKKNEDINADKKKSQLTSIGDTVDLNNEMEMNTKNDNIQNNNYQMDNKINDTDQKKNNKILIPKLNIIEKSNSEEIKSNLNLNLHKNQSEKIKEIKMSIYEKDDDTENGANTERIDSNIVNKIRDMDEDFKAISDEIIYEKYMDSDEDIAKTVIDLKLGITKYLNESK